MPNLSKLAKAKAQAHKETIAVEKNPQRLFKNDFLKHYIRKYFWAQRILKLIRAREDIKTVKYFSLCGEEAYDIRLFNKEKLLDTVGYCEVINEKFELLNRVFKLNGMGFKGVLENIALDTGNDQYGKFWGEFPYDIINLDFWGDIHRGSLSVKNVFYALNAILFQQSLLRKPYELWVTWRAKEDRIDCTIQSEYKALIEDNLNKNSSFKALYNKKYKAQARLNVEDLVNLGFIKWLLYITRGCFSIIQDPEFLVYQRKDKDGNNYRLINALLRIKPFENVVMPSPTCQAARFCKDSYDSNIKICFNKLIDVDKQFESLSKSQKDVIEKDLRTLQVEYEDDKSGRMRK